MNWFCCYGLLLRKNNRMFSLKCCGRVNTDVLATRLVPRLTSPHIFSGIYIPLRICGLCRTSRYMKRIVFWVNFLRVTLNTTKRVNTDVLTQGGFPYGLSGFHISLWLWIIIEVTPWWFPYPCDYGLSLKQRLNGFQISLRFMEYHWGNAWMVSINPCDYGLSLR